MLPMTSATKISHLELQDYIPHRGVNIIPDSVEIQEGWKESSSLTVIPKDDPDGRRIFARKGADGIDYWNEVFLGELLALTGVPMLRPMLEPKGQVAVFSAISKLRFECPIPIDAPIVGKTKITRERGEFIQFSAALELDGQKVFTADIMSGASTFAEICSGSVAAGERPFTGESVKPCPWKPEAMNFVDDILSIDGDAGTIELGYTYPTDHPMVSGHFPEAALMMGVTQWSAFADAAWQFIQAQGLSDGTYKVEGSLDRPDGEPVASVRALELAVEGGMPRIVSTNRIAFRDVIRPGQHVKVKATVTPA